VDDYGNVYVVWHDLTDYNGAGTDADIFYRSWNATSNMWTTTEVVSTGFSGTSYYPSIAVDDYGNVYVVWHDLTDYNGAGTDWDIFYKRWNAITNMWMMTEVVSTGLSGNSYYASIAMDDYGNVNVVWQDLTDYNGAGTDWDIFYKRWNATNNTWMTTAVVSTGLSGNSNSPSIAMDDYGNVYMVWYDITDYNGAGTDADIFYRKLLFDIEAPIITINAPIMNQEFKEFTPAFDISIDEPYLDSTWYTIDGGVTNISFTGLTGIIDQDVWFDTPYGYVTIRFYAKDDSGNVGFKDVIVVKNVLDLIIDAPIMNQVFGEYAPAFEISINNPNIDSTWYTLDGGAINISFTGLIGVIDQVQWDTVPEGYVTIRFYANDTQGNLYYDDVIVVKDTSTPSPSPGGIPGYNTLLLIGIICVVSVILIKKRNKNKV
jgi:hypothetical protein